MIEIVNLVKRFGPVAAVDHLSVEIKPGVTGLVGHNGAGKSTLFRLISDIYSVDEGQILIDGIDHKEVEAKKKVFFLNDNPYGLGNWKQTYDFYANFYEIDLEKYEGLINSWGLPKNKEIRLFSKGMRRQLFIALALSVKCDVLLMDEAFDGIDPLILELIRKEISALSDDGKAIVISSHNISSLERLVDRFLILYKGQLSKEGESEHMGEQMVKFQCVVSGKELSEKDLSSLGLSIVNFRRIGSIYNFVIIETPDCEAKIKESLNPALLERVPIDPDEIVMLEMMLAKKKGDSKHE
ncbi:MAG: ABC transporter ATP-binding protein [Bacillota bacterium]|nr:ABC transporter ATP-binding protein [Bacillota bacterium]